MEILVKPMLATLGMAAAVGDRMDGAAQCKWVDLVFVRNGSWHCRVFCAGGRVPYCYDGGS